MHTHTHARKAFPITTGLFKQQWSKPVVSFNVSLDNCGNKENVALMHFHLFCFMSTFIFNLDIARAVVIKPQEENSFFCVNSVKCCSAPSSIHIHYKNGDHLW